MTFRKWAAGLLLTAAAVSASAATYYVDSKFQGESPSGDSWLSAFPDLCTALEAAATNGGGQVWVRAGVYTPRGSGRNATFTLSADTEIYGGFRGGETNLTQRNPRANLTKLSGDIGRPGSTTDNSYHVITAASNTRIDGFTIQRGNANSAAENRFGGGLRVIPGGENVVAANCTFEKNNAESGGAVHVSVGTLSLSNCTFYSNSADTGGAVTTLGQCTLNIENCIFTSNFAPKFGGALMLNNETKATVSGSSFLYNSTDGFGGAVAANTDKKPGIELTMDDCTFSENSARDNGGAIGLAGPFMPVIQNCTFEKNFSSRGAGAVSSRDGVSTVLMNAVFIRNRGSKGQENIGTDTRSKTVESAAEAEALIAKRKAAEKPAEPKPEPKDEPKFQKQKLPDVFVYNSRDNAKVKLRSIVSDAAYTVLAFGDLTDDAFITHYRSIEAAARDFYPKGVRFYFVYRHLKHPENNGFIKPFSIRERAQHTVVAKKKMQTAVPWLYDTMDNRAAEALIRGDNQLFIYAASGEQVFKGRLEETEDFRRTLADLSGRVEQPFDEKLLMEPALVPIHIPESKYVPRAKISKEEQFQPLELTPQDSRMPFYVKARVEGSKELLSTGSGSLYLGFHIDPLFNVKWNNMGVPLKYVLKTSKGVVAPSVNSAPRVDAAPFDSEPREFILQARQLDLNQPLQLQVTYSVHTSKKKNAEVTQNYMVYLSKDKLGGQVIGRQIATQKKIPKSAAAQNSAYRGMLRRFDIDRNGKLTKDEVIGGLRTYFDDIDKNGDGAIDEAEYTEYRNNR